MAFTGRRSEADLTKQSLKKISESAKELERKVNKNGYSIVFVDDIGFKNLSFTRKQFVKLIEELGNDMPRDDSDLEDSSITEEDFVNWFVNAEADGMTYWFYIAVNNATGLPIALTETRIRATNPDLAYVGDTGVKKEHRGKRLGLTLKTKMLERLLTDPISKNKVRYWITFNAKSNNHMISINDQLGYVQSSLEHMWEIPLDKLKNYFLYK